MKQSWTIRNIDCPNCAQKVEEHLNRLPKVEQARLDYVHQKLTLTAADEDFASVREAAFALIRELEPEAEIVQQPGEEHHGDHDHAGHHHEHGGEADEGWQSLIWKVFVPLTLLGIGLLLKKTFPWQAALLMIGGFLLAGRDVFAKAYRNLRNREFLDETFLMSVAGIGAMLIGEYPEGLAVMALYQLGEYLQDRAVDRSRGAIESLMDIRPDEAVVLRDGREETVSPDQVAIGETIVLRAGMRVPLDAVVLTGESSLNTTALTGESVPKDVREGDTIYSGSVNLSGVLTARTITNAADATVSKILDLVEQSGERKAHYEQLITRLARVYTPVVCISAVLLALIPPIFDGRWLMWIERALSFLVISCPCALVISVPLTFFSGLGGASAKGVLIKGATYMERLAKLRAIVFDKTGTLTRGVFEVTTVHPNGIPEEQLLETAASVEQYSNHPIAASVVAAKGDAPAAADVQELAGLGIRATVDGKTVHVGNRRLMDQIGVEPTHCEHTGTMLHVAEAEDYLGHIVLEDQPKPTAAEAVRGLKAQGVNRLVMLTGDRKAVADDMAGKLGLTEVYADLLPQDKVEKLESLLNEPKDGFVAFVGDGINDAPSLRRSDVGIAMGALGSDAAIEAADVVLMDDDPAKLLTAIRMSRRTVAIAKQNIWMSLGFKVLILLLAAFGLAGMWAAVFADVGICLLAVLNATRARADQ